MNTVVPIKRATRSRANSRARGAGDTPDRSKITLDRAHLIDQGIVGFEHHDIRAYNFQMLRSQILRRLGTAKTHVVAVTSTQAGNGKSFVAANLAAALSQIHPVLIADLDLRFPCVAERFGLNVTTGVDDYLLGSKTLGDRECVLSNEQLTILPVGTPRPNSAEILSSGRTAELFALLRNRPGNPVCIIDTPPVLEGDDMMILAQHVDAILMVVEEGRTPRADIRDCLRMLQPTPILGTVLNKTLFTKSASSYGKYYGREPV